LEHQLVQHTIQQLGLLKSSHASSVDSAGVIAQSSNATTVDKGTTNKQTQTNRSKKK
jgi:hypothetical protein